MQPFKTIPYYRHGSETPWGGVGLREIFGKQIPDDTTGESLEVSAFPRLCCKNAEGVGLDTLLHDFGQPLRGTEIGEDFPLLLKLIHARERLSVQVHPTDEYARLHEGGKLGKTEAWVILDAQPGARIVYGLTPGCSCAHIIEAAARGESIEEYLRWVTVEPGDTIYIPSGTVHAIGEGILLYEIQESSNVTYRLWDWDRRDEQGNLRELHLRKAMDVSDSALQLQPIRMDQGLRRRTTGGERVSLINNRIVSLERLEVRGASMPLEEMPERFRLLTALCEGWMSFPGGALQFSKGDSIFIPAAAGRVKLECEGALLLAAPGKP